MMQPSPNPFVRRTLPRWSAAVCCTAWVGLAQLAVAVPAPSHAPPAWPPSPAEPRVIFSRTISAPADIGVKPPFLRRLADWVTGVGKEQGRLDRPFGLAVDGAGRILVTDTGDNSVSMLDLARKQWTRWEAIGQVRFKSPVAVAVAGATIFVADSALGKVIAFDARGKLRFEITRELERPAGLATAGERLFVADSQRHQVCVFNLRGGFVSQFGRRGDGEGEFNFPTHLSLDAAGLIYVTDSLNHRVQVFAADGKYLRAFGRAGDGPGYFSRPKGVAADRDGHVHVVDAVFDNVQVFDPQGRLLLDWGGPGAGAGQFWLPNAIAINHNQEIFVADSYNHRIQVFRYPGKL